MRKKMSEMTVGIIGGKGNLGTAIARGLRKNGMTVGITTRNGDKELKQTEIRTHESVDHLVGESDVIIATVKPKDMKTVCTSLIRPLTRKPIPVVSLAAGLQLHTFGDWLRLTSFENPPSIFRGMTNVHAAVGQATTGLLTTPSTSEEVRQQIYDIFAMLGHTEWVSTEQQLDILTAFVACNPAWLTLPLEAQCKVAEELGLDPTVSRQLILHTLQGMVTMLQQDSALTFEGLRKIIATPNGVTARGLKMLEGDKVGEAFGRAIRTGYEQCVDVGSVLSSSSKPTPADTKPKNNSARFWSSAGSTEASGVSIVEEEEEEEENEEEKKASPLTRGLGTPTPG